MLGKITCSGTCQLYLPNLLPLAATTQCFPPYMTANAFCDPQNLAAYDILSQSAKVDLTLRTPIFSIHVLHLATARLDVPLLQPLINYPNTPLEAAGTTALGRTHTFKSQHSHKSVSSARFSLSLTYITEDEEDSCRQEETVLYAGSSGCQDGKQATRE